MKAKSKRRIVEVKMDELEEALERAKASLSEKDYEVLSNLADAYGYVSELLEDKKTTIGRLRRLLFGARTEKTADVLKEAEGGQEGAKGEGSAAGDDRGAEPPSPEDGGKGEEKKEGRKGHGRNGSQAYSAAERTEVSHETLKARDPCPLAGCRGKVYRLSRPAVIVRLIGQAPVTAKVVELERLRCNLCGRVFTAKAPEELGEEKYDARTAAMIALLKYGSGLPFNRLERLEGSLGIPLPATTQWDIVHGASKVVSPVFGELVGQAAQGEVLHNDDTGATILEFSGKRLEKRIAEGLERGERTGTFTSGVVSVLGGRRIGLFLTGRKHAGENLAMVLEKRDPQLEDPIQMSDALAQNTSPELKAIVSNCLAHARRQFVDVCESFPQECGHVLRTLAEIYRNDAAARRENLSAEERLRFHREHSRPVMVELRRWFRQRLAERRVEPNSGLGEAIGYMKRHWLRLTRFYRRAGVPLDNNIVERALKKAILHRKNAYFFKTENGARVGDIFMSLIYTAELSGENPFEYLTALLEHGEEVARRPAAWLPWSYRERLVAAGACAENNASAR